MKDSSRAVPIAARIDKLTNSIENALTGESFPTQARRFTVLQARNLAKWQFNWLKEVGLKGREVLQLNTTDNPQIVHGLISLENRPGHIFMHLIESAPFNKGKQKAYLGVAGNLVAAACKRAFELGHEGYVSFDSKTNLVDHYKLTLKATQISGSRMYIGTPAATALVKRYFPAFHIV